MPQGNTHSSASLDSSAFCRALAMVSAAVDETPPPPLEPLAAAAVAASAAVLAALAALAVTWRDTFCASMAALILSLESRLIVSSVVFAFAAAS